MPIITGVIKAFSHRHCVSLREATTSIRMDIDSNHVKVP